MFRFAPKVESLEGRWNPSGPDIIDPITPTSPPNTPPADPAPAPAPAPVGGPVEPPPVDPFINW